MVLGDFTGGTAIAVLGDHMISANYTRTAEANADLFALGMLDRAAVSANGFAGFFYALDDMGGVDLPAYLSTHPVTAERAEQARAFANEQSGTRPVLSSADWHALQHICT